MAGVSKKLTSLVQAADDLEILLYVCTHLGAGVPNDGVRGFSSRVEGLRRQLLLKWLMGGSMNTQQRGQKERQLAIQLESVE